MEGKVEEETPDCDLNWAELHRDVLMVIFLKIGLIDVLGSAEFVCRSWRRVTKEEPDLWRKIDTTNYALNMCYDNGYDTSMVIGLTRLAIDRSMGRLEEFSVADFWDDELLRYLCDRTSVLKKLCLKSCKYSSGSAIAETARRQPLLEEIEIEMEFGIEFTSGSFTEEVTKIVGKECPQLKVFKFNCTWENYEAVDDVALGIAETMHQLRHLELIDNKQAFKKRKTALNGEVIA